MSECIRVTKLREVYLHHGVMWHGENMGAIFSKSIWKCRVDKGQGKREEAVPISSEMCSEIVADRSEHRNRCTPQYPAQRPWMHMQTIPRHPKRVSKYRTENGVGESIVG